MSIPSRLRRAVPILFPMLCILAGVPHLQAEDLTWVGSTSSTWDTTTVNWDSNGDGTADTTFSSGDNAFFINQGPSSVSISGSVDPNTVSFTGQNYTLTGAPLGGGSAGSTTLSTSVDLALQVDATYAGDTEVTGNGALLHLAAQSSGTHALGTGTLTLNDESNLRFTGATAGAYELTTDIVAGHGSDLQWQNTAATSTDFSGGITATGSLLDLNRTNFNPGSGTTFTGPLTITQNLEIFSGTSPDNAPTYAGAIGHDGSGPHSLRINAQHLHRTFKMGGTGAGDIAALTATGDVVVDITADAATNDYFSNLRANGGRFTVRGETVMRRGTFDLDSDFTRDNGEIYFRPTAADAVVLTDATLSGTGLDEIDVSGNPSGTLTVDDGGRLIVGDGQQSGYAGSNPVLDTTTVLDGGTLVGAYDNLSSINFTSGQQLVLGDGAPSTTETVTIQINGSHTKGPLVMQTAGTGADSNVLIRYEQLSQHGKLLWDLSPGNADGSDTFVGGTAGTVFHAQVDHPFIVMGPNGENVFEAHAPTRITGDEGVLFYQTNGTGTGNERRLATGDSDIDANVGAVAVRSGGTLQIEDPAAVVWASSIQVDDGGMIGGIGAFNAPITADGTVSPGTSTGTLNATEDLALTGSSTLLIEFAGETSGQFDVLDVDGLLDITAGSTLDLRIIDGYDPTAGTTFDILDWGTISGTGNFTVQDNLPSHKSWDLSNLYTDGQITALPEPTTALLALLATTILLLRRRVNRH